MLLRDIIDRDATYGAGASDTASDQELEVDVVSEPADVEEENGAPAQARAARNPSPSVAAPPPVAAPPGLPPLGGVPGAVVPGGSPSAEGEGRRRRRSLLSRPWKPR